MKTIEINECGIIGKTLTRNDVNAENDITEKRISGIYKIVNKINGKYYVGSSKNINGEFGRWYIHKLNLNKLRHQNKHLQNAWNKYGEDNFEFIIIEPTEPILKILMEVEQKYLNIAKTEQDRCYNTSFISSGGPVYKIHPMKGRCHSPESKLKNSNSNKIAQRGKNNARYNDTIYTFYNKITNDIFIGSSYDFYTKYNLKNNIYQLIKGKIKQIQGWVINPSLDLKRPSGKSHYLYDKNIHNFYNKETNELFIGTQHDFYTKFQLNKSKVNLLVNRKRKLHKNWIIRNPLSPTEQ